MIQFLEKQSKFKDVEQKLALQTIIVIRATLRLMLWATDFYFYMFLCGKSNRIINTNDLG